MQLQPFVLQSLLPQQSVDIFRYQGSLTTPTCNEGVIWTVARQKISLSASQVEFPPIISKCCISAAVKLTGEIIDICCSWMHFANLRLLLVTPRHLSTSLPTTVPPSHAISDPSMLVDQPTRHLSISFPMACCCLFHRLLGFLSLPIIHPVRNTSYYVYSYYV